MVDSLIREEVTPEAVRRHSGADEDIISDKDIEELIVETRKNFELYLNTKFLPTEDIEIQHIDHASIQQKNFKIYHGPLLNIYEVRLGDKKIEDFRADYLSGVLYIQSPINAFHFDPLTYSRENTDFRARILYGTVEKDESEKSFITEDIEPGDEVEVKVDDAENIKADEWVWIEGMDGNREACEVKERDTQNNKFTISRVTQKHEEGSLIYRLRVEESIKSLITYEVVIRIAIKATGGTYKFNTTYSLGDMSVSKGVPYTHWQQVYNQASQKREDILKNTAKQKWAIL